jgi:SAM-dependent methyltransferase
VPYYNHNDHYAGLVLRHAPQSCTAALDIGCGEGRLLAKLAALSDVVVGIDRDTASIEVARRCAPDAVEVIEGDFLDHDFGDRDFDFITAVASLHHMAVADALRKMSQLLRPGGVIAIVGLYRAATAADRLVELAAVPLNAALAWSRPSEPMTAPAIDPTTSLTEIRSAVAPILPGARTRRLLLWRYLLTWTKLPQK